MSCLNALESARKYGEEKLEVAQEAVPSAKQPVEGLSVVDSTDVPLVSGFFLSDTISQQMNSGCEDTKDVQLVDSEGHILEASSSTIREPNLKEPELPFPGSNVENKDVDDECCAKQHHVISSSDNNIEPHSNGVCGNGVAARDDAFASLCTGEVLNESHPYSSGGKTEMVKESGKGMPPSHIIDVGADKYDGEVINESHPYSSGGKTEMVKESGKGMPPSHIIDVGADKYDGRKSSGSKPKPLFDPGFLQNCPLKKYSEEVKSPVLIGQLTSVCNFHGENNRFIDTDLSIQNESGIRGGGPYILSDFSGKQTANSEDGIQMVTSKFSDSNIPQMRSSGFPHMPCDSLDIGNNSSSGEESIPVGNSCASSSTTAVVLNEPNCFISEVKQKKLEVEKGSLSLLVTEDVSAGEKDGRKYSGSKPLFRPGFLGKHPRESIQRKKQ